jgi:DNA-binding transcriptional ArsR family regulator/DNA-binding PadR family transcriptional regulator
MDEANQLAKLSAQLGDPARAAIVISLMDGSSRPTGELQISANVSPSSASTHLSKLVSARILTVVKQGRLKYYRIATAAVAHAVEALTVVASPGASLQAAARSPLNPFSFARTCYDHLAGKLGVEIVTALQDQNVIRPLGKSYEITARGSHWLERLDIHCKELRSGRRLFATQCLDFTERRHHLGGALGAALLKRMVELGWIAKSRVPRAVRLTDKGQNELHKRLRLEFTDGQTVKYKPQA